MRFRLALAATLILEAVTVAPRVAVAKKKKPVAAAAAAPKPSSPETVRAIEKLMGKFKWGMSSEDAMKIVEGGIRAEFDARIDATRDPFKQDQIRKEEESALKRMRESYVKFDGQRTGWDVSLVDAQFAHGNDESMLVMAESNQRRFLFFWQDKLYKMFVAFNADHPAFQGKSFDDFADIIQRTYGPASLTFKKARGSDEQTFDHLEWQPPGDYLLWALDMTSLYNNYCLSLIQKSVLPQIDKARAAKGVATKATGGAGNLVDAVLKSSDAKDTNKDVVDEITGEDTRPGAQKKPATAPASDPIEGSGIE